MDQQQRNAYAGKYTHPEQAVLQQLNRDTHVNVLRPRMLSGHLQGRLLQMISQMLRPKVILEIGTYTGYGTICLSAGLAEDGQIHTIEINEELEDFAKAYFVKAGIESRVVYHLGAAAEVIPTLHETFDLVFIDADKENYIQYYEQVIGKVSPGGYVLADNVLWGGKVLNDPDPSDKETMAIRQFNEHIYHDPRVENLILPFRDGIMLMRKK